MEHNIKQINDRGYLTIPSEIRKYLNLSGGDYTSLKVNELGKVELIKVEIKELENSIKKGIQKNENK